MLYKLGLDAVGMSTVHEVIVNCTCYFHIFITSQINYFQVVTAKHCDLTVLGISLITNKCVIDYDDMEEASHSAVVEIAQSRQKILSEFVKRIIKHIHSEKKN